MGYTVIAPIGPNMQALFIGMKEFPTERVILLAMPNQEKEAKKISDKLDLFTIKTSTKILKGNILESVFKEFAILCNINDNDDLIVNVATGAHAMTCATLSAAYANGLKAFDIMGETSIMLPIMKLSYYHELSNNKMEIIRNLDENDYEPIASIAKRLKISISLLSYHINGNDKYKGLKEHRLIETKLINKNLHIKLSSMGSLLLKGYIKEKQV